MLSLLRWTVIMININSDADDGLLIKLIMTKVIKMSIKFGNDHRSASVRWGHSFDENNSWAQICSELFSNKVFAILVTNIAFLSDLLPCDKCHHWVVALLKLFQHQVLEEILTELFVLKSIMLLFIVIKLSRRQISRFEKHRLRPNYGFANLRWKD